MIARHEEYRERADVWASIAAPLPAGVVSWRQDGRIVARDGRYFARFVAYIDANTVRERLDAVVPGEWDLALELLPPLASTDEEGDLCSFKARLQVLGVVREDVGTGRDYKAAATDAFKRAAVRFGVAHELYAYEQNWVQMDGDDRHARPLEEPQAAYERRYGPAGRRGDAADDTVGQEGGERSGGSAPNRAARSARSVRPARSERASRVAAAEQGANDEPAGIAGVLAARDEAMPACPNCGGRMWDNRLTKRNPRAPDFKCRDRGCDGVIWPERQPQAASPEGTGSGPLVEAGSDAEREAGSLPF